MQFQYQYLIHAGSHGSSGELQSRDYYRLEWSHSRFPLEKCTIYFINAVLL